MKKHQWLIAVISLLIAAPTLVLCVLFLTDREKAPTLADLAAAAVFDIRAEGESTSVTLKKNAQSAEERESYRLLVGFLDLAREKTAEKSKGEQPVWLYTVTTKKPTASCRLGMLEEKAVVGYREKLYIFDYPALYAASDVRIVPTLIRYGLLTDDGYLDAPHISQSTAQVYVLTSPADLRALEFRQKLPAYVKVIVYPQGEDEHVAIFDSLSEVTFDTSRNFDVVVNVSYVEEGYRVQCSYEFSYIAR